MEGQEDQEKVEKKYGDPPRDFRVTWASLPSFWLFPGLPGAPSDYLNKWLAFGTVTEKAYNRV